ncbi:6-bladed beta-propeller [Algoriphagus sp. AGSA1]|uniref:6-bladed beta-propeller n=1 Tax=Algoriphagus sp. AGSA1 TaxID=2907213 RepID=UPI001F4893C4|nr:6-bladed beta-propeller [Algoriphagus sp. AGSA1]MCE7056696.1 6-bladed beta-propeller [Algoriphagus sp. AGSA1]
MRKIIAFALLSVIGCGESRVESVKTIDFDALEKVSADLLIEKAIPLASDSTELLGEYLWVMYDKDGYYAMNNFRGKGIHHFSNEGKHLGIIAEIGEAPGQVPEIRNFRVLEEEVLVNSGMGNSLELHTFSKSGKLLKSTPYPINAFAFYPLNQDEVWYYSSYNSVAGDHRLFVADGSGAIRKELLSNDFNEKMLPMDEQSFFEGNEAVLFRESFKGNVYQLSEEDSLKEVYTFDFGPTAVPEKFWEMDAFAGFEMINKQGFSNIAFLEENEQYFVAYVNFQKERDIKKTLYVWNKKTDKEFIMEIDGELGYFNSLIGLEGDQLVFIAYAPYLVRNSEKLNLSDKAKASLATVTEDSNPVILYAKIPG